LSAHDGAKKLIMDFYNKKKIVAFICAGTLVAKAAGIPSSHTVTSYPAPAVKDQLVNGKITLYSVYIG
jgi:protein DJ-1